MWCVLHTVNPDFTFDLMFYISPWYDLRGWLNLTYQEPFSLPPPLRCPLPFRFVCFHGHLGDYHASFVIIIFLSFLLLPLLPPSFLPSSLPPSLFLPFFLPPYPLLPSLLPPSPFLSSFLPPFFLPPSFLPPSILPSFFLFFFPSFFLPSLFLCLFLSFFLREFRCYQLQICLGGWVVTAE